MATEISSPVAGGGYDAYAPSAIAERVATAGCIKATLPFLPLVTLSVLAGAFIALGAAIYVVVTFQFGLGPGATRLFGGVAFSLGLALIVIGGAELFTGNNLIVMARCDGLIGTPALPRNWTIVYLGNFLGAATTAVIVHAAGIIGPEGGDLAQHVRGIAMAKTALPVEQAFFRGLLCNVLVCLAVWLSYAGHSVTEKIVAVVFPITAFVALGLEHSVANMFFLPLGLFAGLAADIGAMIANLAVVMVGNIIGGSVFVGIVYWIIYRHRA